MSGRLLKLITQPLHKVTAPHYLPVASRSKPLNRSITYTVELAWHPHYVLNKRRVRICDQFEKKHS